MVKYEDLFMKDTMADSAEDIFSLVNIHEVIVDPYPTEIQNIVPGELVLDFVMKTETGFIDFEFESTKITDDDIRRFLVYATLLHREVKCPVNTYIICSANVDVSEINYKFSDRSYFRPVIISLKGFDVEKIINNIEDKILNNQKLSLRDLTVFSLTPLMVVNISPGEQIEFVVNKLHKWGIEKTELTEEQFQRLFNRLSLLVDKFVKGTKRDNLWEKIKMKSFMLDRSRQEGREESMVIIGKTVNMLLNKGCSVDEIINETGLSR